MRSRALVTTWMLTCGLAFSAAPVLAAGSSSDQGDGGSSAPAADSASQTPPPDPAASGGAEYGSSTGRSTSRPAKRVVKGFTARILADGTAAAPAMAPAKVQRAIWAANHIVGRPYVYGGGHNLKFRSRGYDCSGTVSYALHGGRMLRSPLDSGSFMRWGAKGKGTWMTIWTNPGHAFIIIAGLRLDTSAAGDPSGAKGPRWRPVLRSTRGFVSRHPVGY